MPDSPESVGYRRNLRKEREKIEREGLHSWLVQRFNKEALECFEIAENREITDDMLSASVAAIRSQAKRHNDAHREDGKPR